MTSPSIFFHSRSFDILTKNYLNKKIAMFEFNQLSVRLHFQYTLNIETFDKRSTQRDANETTNKKTMIVQKILLWIENWLLICACIRFLLIFFFVLYTKHRYKYFLCVFYTKFLKWALICQIWWIFGLKPPRMGTNFTSILQYSEIHYK